jgi:acetyl esterase/lipase/predicted SnoaL-like aldol condensation-catalyzing enzyme
MAQTIEQQNKALVLKAFNTLFNEKDYEAAEKFWSPDYIQHSAHIPPGRDGLFGLVKAAPAAMRYENSLTMADGDMLMLHGRFTKHGGPAAWITLDVVRLEDGRLAEHWEVIADEVTREVTVSGLPMYGESFPDSASDSQPGGLLAAAPPGPDGAGGPSLLLQAFVEYLRAGPTKVDTKNTREFNQGHQLEGVNRRATDLGGVSAITVEPRAGLPDRTVVYFHGGGYISGSPPDRYLALAAGVALAANARVHVVDYRLAPETPFPGAFDDCLAAYRWLIGDGRIDPRTLAVLGDSAGGNLAVAVTVAARDQDLPLPASVAIISPLADLTFSGASIEQRKDMDPYVSHELLEFMAAGYMGDSDRSDPRSSVVFADLHGLPPLLIQVGENEILYDDATRIRDSASAAGVEVTFESWRYGIHVWPVYVSAGLPESAIAIEHLAAFLKAHAQHDVASTPSTSSTS